VNDSTLHHQPPVHAAHSEAALSETTSWTNTTSSNATATPKPISPIWTGPAVSPNQHRLIFELTRSHLGAAAGSSHRPSIRLQDQSK